MRVLVLPIQLVEEKTSLPWYSVPDFPEDLVEGAKPAWGSNIYIRKNKIDEGLFARGAYDRQLIATKGLQTTNLMAYYDHTLEKYWVAKNRYSGRIGWYPKADFLKLVELEVENMKGDSHED